MTINLWDRRTWGAVREAKGITYAEIAEACQVYPGTPEKWFNSNTGSRNPSLKHQIQMAEVLGINIEDALTNLSPDIRDAIRSAL
jgi:transcriptional regulator with XRE-family HTH domain